MAITLTQAAVAHAGTSTNITVTYGSACTPGTLLVAAVHYPGGASTAINGVSDPTNGSWTLDATAATNADVGYASKIFSVQNTASTALTVTLAMAAFDDGAITIYELSGAATSSAVDATGTDAGGFSTTNPSMVVTTGQANSCIIATCAYTSADWSVAAGTNFTFVQSEAAGSGAHADERWLNSGAAGAQAVGFTLTSGTTGPYGVAVAVAYKSGAAAVTPLGMFGGN